MSALDSVHGAKDAGQEARGAFCPVKLSGRPQRIATMTILLLVPEYYDAQVFYQLVFDNE